MTEIDDDPSKQWNFNVRRKIMLQQALTILKTKEEWDYLNALSVLKMNIGLGRASAPEYISTFENFGALRIEMTDNGKRIIMKKVDV